MGGGEYVCNLGGNGKLDILSQRIAKNQKDIFSYPLYWRNHGKNSSKRNTGVTDFALKITALFWNCI